MSKSVKPEGNSVLKNMAIGVTTSVLGATIIYFLGFNNKKPSFTKLEREEITTQTWKTYVTVENIYTKNTVSLLHDVLKFGGSAEVLKETNKESEKFQNSVKDMIAADGVDKDMVSFLKQRLEDEIKEGPETEKFYKGLDELAVTAKKGELDATTRFRLAFNSCKPIRRKE
jgi:cell division FtsZ-interacting protein ZapD